jgi:hypothetical protein
MTDDFQMMFNIAITLAGFLGGWVLNSLKSSMEALQKADHELTIKVQSVEVLVAGSYVKREDLDKLSSALFAKLDKIEAKLDSKVDK